MIKSTVKLLATGLGLGLLPKAPGTFGTLLGVVLAVLFPDNLWLVTGACVLGIWIANEGEKIFNQHDCPKIVIDEIAGFLVASYGWHGYQLIYAFILFRIFDIVKPFPVRQLQKLPGGLGVMVDDIAAGLLANLVIYMVTHI